MHVTGKVEGCNLTLDGKLNVTFSISEKAKALKEIEAIKDAEKLVIDVKKYRNHRSLDANAYFWQMVDKIAKKLESEKWTVYLLMLSKYGIFTDLVVTAPAVPMLAKSFRYTETLRETEIEGDPAYIVRCFYGSSEYDSKEMSDLINGTVRDARELGIDTATPDEISRMVAAWKGMK